MDREAEYEEATKTFGFGPGTIGLRHRSWWIVTEPDEDDQEVGAEKGWLCVRARDGALNPVDWSATKWPNFVDSREDGFDSTYRYYWFKPLSPPPTQSHQTRGVERWMR